MNMTDKRVWIVIGCILVIGSGVTFYTNSYVRSQVSGGQMISRAGSDWWNPGAGGQSGDISIREGAATTSEKDSPISETAPSAENDMLSDTSAGIGGRPPGSLPAGEALEPNGRMAEEAAGPSEQGPAVAETAVMAEDGLLADEAAAVAEDGAAAAPVPISPLTGVRPRDEKTALVTDYRQRLKDLDNQIQKMRKEDRTDSSSNVYSIKTSAQTELKLWEGELNSIYNALLEMLSREDAAALAAEQQEWLKKRDLKAAECTSKTDSSVEGLGYAATLVSLTRERAYELAGKYEEANGIVVEREEEETSAEP